MGSRCLIAGCGYLGLRVAKSLLEQNFAVSALTRSERRADTLQTLGVNPIVANLGSPAADVQLPPADYVLWSVGFESGGSTSRTAVWLDGLRWLMRSLAAAPKRFIYVSSTSVYGVSDGEVDESVLPAPTTEGGKVCWQAERLLQSEFANTQSSTRAIVLRLAGIYGPDRLLRRVEQLREQAPVAGSGSAWLNLIHVEDAVRLITEIIATPNSVQIPTPINVVNSETLTRAEYYGRLADLAQTPPPVFDEDLQRRRGGNKRVVTQHQPLTDFRYNNVAEGIEHAWKDSIR